MLTDERIYEIYRATNTLPGFARACIAESQPVAESRVAQLQAVVDELANLNGPASISNEDFMNRSHKLVEAARALRSATPKEPT